MRFLAKTLFLLLFTPILFAQSPKTLTYNYVDDNGYSCKSYLYVNGKESLFTMNDDRKSGSNETPSGMIYKVYNDKWSRIFYKNEKINLTRIPIYGKDFTYQSNDLAGKIMMTGKTKTIGKYKCQEAMVNKGGRSYAVWFTPDVPMNVGPININNMPGLIVEISDTDSKNFNLKLIEISKTVDLEKFNLYKTFITGKKAFSSDDYKKQMIKLISNVKRDNNAILAKMNATIEFSEDQRFYTVHLVDIPENLVKELQKITQ